MLNFKARLIKALKKLGLKVNNKVPDGKDYPEIINSIADSYTGGGTTVVANPELVGTEPNLTGLEVEGIKYKAPEQKQADWNQTNNQEPDFIKNKPTIPTVNNATITFTQGGTTKGSFTLNQSADGTIELDAGGGGGATGTIVTYTDPNYGNHGYFVLLPLPAGIASDGWIPAIFVYGYGWMYDASTMEYKLNSVGCKFQIDNSSVYIYGNWFDNSSDKWDTVTFTKEDFSGLPE